MPFVSKSPIPGFENLVTIRSFLDPILKYMFWAPPKFSCCPPPQTNINLFWRIWQSLSLFRNIEIQISSVSKRHSSSQNISEIKCSESRQHCFCSKFSKPKFWASRKHCFCSQLAKSSLGGPRAHYLRSNIRNSNLFLNLVHSKLVPNEHIPGSDRLVGFTSGPQSQNPSCEHLQNKRLAPKSPNLVSEIIVNINSVQQTSRAVP